MEAPSGPKKPHYVPFRWRTSRGESSARFRVVMRCVEQMERQFDMTSRPSGLVGIHTTFGHVVFKPGELPIWISAPTG